MTRPVVRSLQTVALLLLSGLSLIFVPVLSATAAQQEQTQSQESSEASNFHERIFVDQAGEHRYQVYVPSNYTADKKWPVLLFLHGAGERGKDGKLPIANTLAVALEQWKDAPFLAVFPQCEAQNGRALTGWLADRPDAIRALKILESVESEFSIDTAHRMLAGWSMGGYGAWSLASQHPEMWSSVLILAGGALGDELPLAELAKQRVPVWAISGQKDPMIPWERSQKLIQSLNEQDGNGYFTPLPSGTHTIAPLVFAEPRVFDWLLNPSEIDQTQIDFQSVSPLPILTRAYRENSLHVRPINQAMAFRIGNDALKKLGPSFAKAIPAESLSGSLDDISEVIGTGRNKWKAVLSGLTYDCQVTECRVQAVSGGRLRLDIHLNPLTINIKNTSLKNAKNDVRTGEMKIQIGLHRPAVLRLEFQPEIQQDRLKLTLLTQSFDVASNNWYISPPTKMAVRKSEYSKADLKTGIVGSLYESRKTIQKQVLSVVPALVEELQAGLQTIPASQVSEALSPIPGLLPYLELQPAQVSVDPKGVSVVLNLHPLTPIPGDALPIEHPITVQNLAREDHLELQIGLQAIANMTQVSVDQRIAKVDVLDISEENFGAFTHPEQVKKLFPDRLDLPTEPNSIRAVLRLLAPLTVTEGEPSSASATTSKIDLNLIAERAAIDFYQINGEDQTPIGRITFQLSQHVTVASEESRSNSDQNPEFTGKWADECRIDQIMSEELDGIPPQRINAEEFHQQLSSSWLNWVHQHASTPMCSEFELNQGQFLFLNAIQIKDDRLEGVFGFGSSIKSVK